MAKTLISKEYQDLIAQLEQDVQNAFQNVAGNDQFWCRTLVRAVFSYFEAHSFVIRSSVAKLLKPDQGNLEYIAKMALLAETTYQPGKTGSSNARRRRGAADNARRRWNARTRRPR